ncbi:MAG: hypothetical protein NC393_01730 [Clostridium sp.]|nr:hypothetical protein [Clostridium sp.]MCM1170824.1 hypothetical protein [Clostridium sp.]MCM1208445.1 hypothetical protein [Ruminococcus sp.]
MERDFTEEVEQQMLEMVEGHYDIENPLDIMDEFNAYREYLVNRTDIEYAMQHIEEHKQFLIRELGFDAEAIRRVFSHVREYDAEYPETVEKNTNDFFTPYLESLKGLLETIRVSGGESPYTNAEDFAIMAREQYGKYGNVAGAGLFSSTYTFSQKLENAGGGAVKTCYLAIKDIDGDEFQELINKPMEEIKPWEVAALSMVYDDCVDENGTVNIYKLQKLVNRCYIVEHHLEASIDCVIRETNVTAAPIMSLLSSYRTEKSAQMSILYGNLDTKNFYGILLQDVKADCYITDVVFSIDTYCHDWSDISLPGYPSDDLKKTEYMFPIDLTMDEDKITIDFKGSKDIVTIYEYTFNFNEETGVSDIAVAFNDIVENPEKEACLNTAKYTVDQAVGALPGLGNVYSAASGAYELKQNYYEDLKKNEETLKKIKGKELQLVVYTTGCSGSIVQCGNRYDVRNFGLDTGYVIQQVALYNECVDRGVETGEKIAGYTEVQAEFNDYMSGRRALEDCKAINALFNFEHAEKCYGFENAELGIRYNYDSYITLVQINLQTGNEENVSDYMVHTNSEVEAASEIAAKKWCDHMEGK